MDFKNSFSLKGKVAIITGGAGILGPKFGEALLEMGAAVVLADINKKKGGQVVQKLSKKFKSRVAFEEVDISSEQSVKNLVDRVARKFKKIDILINAAIGVGKKHFTSIEDYSYEDWNHVMQVTVGGTYLCSKYVAEVMKKKKSGVIINMGSIYGVVGADQRIYGKSGINSPAVYAASKGALINLTRYYAVYWAPFGIRVNSISPGGVYNGQDEKFVKKYSERTPMGRMLDRKELMGAVVYLCSSASSSVTGHNLMVDGGWTAW